MIDKKITINKLEDLTREVARVEFSTDFRRLTCEVAEKCRKELEELIKLIRLEP